MPDSAETVDVRVIRQSMRCFWCGALGAIPGIGLGLATVALKLFHGVARQSGDSKHVAFPISLAVGTLTLNPFLQTAEGWPAAVVTIFLTACAQGLWFTQACARSQATKWNPARRWAWAGAALAFIQLFIWIAAAQMFFVNAYYWPLIGLR